VQIGVKADSLFLKGKNDDLVYGPTSFSSDSRFVGLISSRRQSSACFLLSATGRMKFTAGGLVIGGFDASNDAGQLREMSCVANIRGVDDLDPTENVRRHSAEVGVNADFRDAWRQFFPFAQAPNPTSVVGTLSDEQQLCLKILLAYSQTPRLLVVGGVGDIALRESRWNFLDTLCELYAQQSGEMIVLFDYGDARDFCEWRNQQRSQRRSRGRGGETGENGLILPDAFYLDSGQRVNRYADGDGRDGNGTGDNRDEKEETL
jgi:hypothetical protein